ncbi:uncharacterized protein LOC115822948 isoform X2 [Chanos chanos]|uniref:Uncharacterized protein LOC115822948 isoform X2 n=1 Tax=Chanos chanos TaxID=29144 RepID=A0A6J2WBN5_CHACN|nr:coiled-coil domain-containing protein 107 isoform X2 [Chanos chanos]
MVLTSSQQVVVAFTAVLFVFVVFPRMFGGGTGLRDTRAFDARYNRKAGPAASGLPPGAINPQKFSMNAAGPQGHSAENIHQMKKLMEHELKSDKYKSSNKGYVFTLMPLYAIGVGVFAAYKFLKIKSGDDSNAQRVKATLGAKKSEETENQLNELEQRLAQTEKMLNSILTQLDPLTNCVKSVATEQKNELMSQLQCIRHLMKKRGMECPPMTREDLSCEHNLEDLIESLAAATQTVPSQPLRFEPEDYSNRVVRDEPMEDENKIEEEREDQGSESDNSMPSLEDSGETNIDNIEIIPNIQKDIQPGLRRRNRLE